MSILQAALDAFRSSQYRAPAALVPVESRAEESAGKFSFGVPWPWYVEDGAQHSSGAVSSLQVSAPRSGQPATVVIQILPEKTEIDESSVSTMARQFAKQRGGRSGGARRLRVAGLPAIELSVSSGADHHRMVVLPDEDVTIQMDAHFPESCAAGYGAHLETMLATWSWH